MDVKFRSTEGRAPLASFGEALFQGQAPDRGLYVPVEIPKLSAHTWAALQGAGYVETARAVLAPFLSGFIPGPKLKSLLEDAYDFPVPVERVWKRRYLLRLDRGPSLSFKDFAARLMARLMAYGLQRSDGELCILTATSGDTGGAVANAFFGLDRIRVVVLFPLQEITERQRLQITTLGANIRAAGVEGKFDDCQMMVKDAFADPGLEKFNLTSANSINFGRLVPQAVYYVYAYMTVCGREGFSFPEPAVFSVPCGNFGNLCGGVVARCMGLPVKLFVAGTNENDEFPRYLESGKYEKVVPSRKCISSAMNVGHPSNLARLIDFYGGWLNGEGRIRREPDLSALRRDFASISVTDGTCRRVLKEAYEKHGLILEPHGAVAWHALNVLRKDHESFSGGEVEIALETAHPAKFPEEVEEAIGRPVTVPAELSLLKGQREEFSTLRPEYSELKRFIRESRGV